MTPASCFVGWIIWTKVQVLNFSTQLSTFTTPTWVRAAKFSGLNCVDSDLECVEKIGFASIDLHALGVVTPPRRMENGE
jgi:hypothetical protein